MLRRWPCAFLLAYFFWFAWRGLVAQLTDNDLINLTVFAPQSFSKLLWSNVTYWSAAYRPMGGLAYKAAYRWFGMSPLPMRVFCFALLLVNLWLLYCVARRLARSVEVALLATLLLTYHAWFVDLYYSLGTVFELLCFAFYFAAFGWYVRIRGAGRLPAAREWLVFVALYIAALNSKELAATLPLAIAAYEWIWHGRRGSARGALLSAAITVPYVIGKLTGADSLIANPSYRPEISGPRYVHAMNLYLDVLFYHDHFFRPWKTLLLLAILQAVAVWKHSRPLMFGWFFAVSSVLPFIFIPHYSGFFMYLPAVGWALYGATALAMLRRAVSRAIPPAAVFLGVAAVLAPAHAATSAKTMHVFETTELPTRAMIAELRRVAPALPRGARVFFKNDPFPAGTEWLAYLVRLVYADPAIEVVRAKDGGTMDGRHFDAVLDWQNGRLTR